ncbi:MAG: hypothetical protein WKG07_23320 [Hymenobacter sp.]
MAKMLRLPHRHGSRKRLGPHWPHRPQRDRRPRRHPGPRRGARAARLAVALPTPSPGCT